MALDSIFRRILPAVKLVILATLLSASFFCAAQTAASAHGNAQPPVKSAKTASGAKKHKAHSYAAKATPPAVAAAPVLPPPPPPPNWPANDKPVPASVNWNGKDLTIAATNASLQQILTQVSSATGVKVDGAESDQRIFGSYGPASARDVLSQLLDGSGYNVLIIGDKGEGTPRELVLTARTRSTGSTSQSSAQSRQNSDDEAPEEPEQQQPEPTNVIQHRQFPVQPGQGRSPEQLQEEQQQRIEQMREQQQQQPQQQQNPFLPPNPPKD